jgi:hypothetical protein
MQWRASGIFFLIVVLFFFSSPKVYASVVINEVMPAPSQGDEWIELKNLGSSAVDLSGWSLEDNTGLLPILPSFQSLSLTPKSIVVLETKNRLNNTGDKLTLKQPDGEPVDFFEFSTTTPDLSWSRNAQGTFSLSAPTKGSENPLLTPSPSASAAAEPSPWPSPVNTTPPPTSSPQPSPLATLPLQLSEIMACPETGESEWVEFFNPNSTTVTLTGWKLRDSSSNSRTFSLTIAPLQFTATDLSSAILNNDGDALIVLDQSGNEVLSYELPECEKGQSYVFTNGSWISTSSPTKNQMNYLSLNAPSVSPSPESFNLSPFHSEGFISTWSAQELSPITLTSQHNSAFPLITPSASVSSLASESSAASELPQQVE